jgi:monoamine oxidase
MGGQFVGPTQHHILGLIEAFGLSLYPTYVQGDHIFYRDGRTTRYDAINGPIPPIGEVGIGQLLVAIERLHELAADVRPDRPWQAPNAAEWDRRTFQEWIDANVDDPGAVRVIEYVVRGTNTCEPSQLSLLHLASYVAAAGDDQNPGSILRVVVTADGASMYRIAGGSQQLPALMAALLDEDIVLSTPVTRIDQRPDKVVVYAGRSILQAKHVIVATPPVVSKDIVFDPPLPESRIQISESLLPGAQIKVNVVYKKPFWRESGLSGYVLSESGPVQNVWDNTPAAGNPGVLVCFIKGDAARSLDTSTDIEVQRAVIANLVSYFGHEASAPTQVLLKRWHHEPWIKGCPGSLAPPGVLTSWGKALRDPVGRIHWAGTETAVYWQGFMDGAVASGLRASHEVIAASVNDSEPRAALGQGDRKAVFEQFSSSWMGRR